MANRLYEIYSKHTGQPADVIGMSDPRVVQKAVFRAVNAANRQLLMHQ